MALYMALSAFQIRRGYRQGSQQTIGIMSIGTNNIARFIYHAYRLIPFLFELRVILDWAVTATSLDIFMWINLEDLHNQLWLNHLQMAYRREQHEILSGKRRQPVHIKLLQGFLSFVIMMTLIMLPMILFSNLNPALQPNLVHTGSLEAQFSIASSGASVPIYSAQTVGSSLTGDDFEVLIQSALVGDTSSLPGNYDAQCASFHRYSSDTWSIPPPIKASLLDALSSPSSGDADGDGVEDSSDVALDLFATFQRQGPSGYETVRLQFSQPLSAQQRMVTYQMLSGNLTAGPLHVPAIYPELIQLSSTSDLATPMDVGEGEGLNLMLQEIEGLKYWDIWTDVLPMNRTSYCWQGSATESVAVMMRTQGVIFNLVSIRYVPQVASTLGLGSASVFGLYSLILITIGGGVRRFVNFDLIKLFIHEIPDSTDLLELCQGIRTVRAQNYDGALKDEMKLYLTLLHLLRNPGELMRVTRLKRL